MDTDAILRRFVSKGARQTFLRYFRALLYLFNLHTLLLAGAGCLAVYACDRWRLQYNMDFTLVATVSRLARKPWQKQLADALLDSGTMLYRAQHSLWFSPFRYDGAPWACCWVAQHTHATSRAITCVLFVLAAAILHKVS
jgi:hypothetical protein